MRALITYLILLFPLSVLAQNEDVNISYSEEKVESFEKTTLIDEYEKAFGNNRVVKSALRGSLNGVVPNTSLSPYSPYPFRNFMRNLNPILQFEQKISTDKSLIASFSGNRNKEDLFWNSDIGLEGRWYYQMKKRVAEGKQQPNIIGKYLSLKVEANPYRDNSRYEYIPDYRIFKATSTYSVNWGWQLGNNANYGLSVGIKHGSRARIDNERFWVNAALSGKTATTLFITTNAQVGLGLLLPLKKRIASNSCDFLQCNYEVKQLFKVNLNNMLYMDRYSQNLNLDIAYERKIGRSPFSINSNIKTSLYNRFFYNPTGYKIDTTITFTDNGGIITNIDTRYTYTTALHSNIEYNFEIAEQLRYYIGMKNRISRGKSASNLNGIYVGLLGDYRIVNSRSGGVDTNNSAAIINYSINYLTGGLSIGYQLQTNRRSFLDISTNFLREKYTFPDKYSSPGFRTVKNSLINLSLKLGFAR